MAHSNLFEGENRGAGRHQYRDPKEPWAKTRNSDA